MILERAANMTTEENLDDLFKKAKQLLFEKSRDAIQVFEQAAELSLQIKNYEKLITAYTGMCQSYCDPVSDYQKALACCEKALEVAQTHNLQKALIKIYSYFGLCHHYLGDMEVSHRYYLQSLQLAEENTDKTQEDIIGLGTLYYNMAILFKTQDYMPLRLNYLERSIEIQKQTGNKVGLSRCYNAFSAHYAANGQPEKALEYQLMALNISKEIDDRNGISIYYNNVGSMYIDLKEYETGLDFLFKGLELKKQIGNRHSIGVSQMHLGIAYKEMGQYKEAIEWLLEAEKTHIEINSRVSLNDIYRHLSECCEKLEDFRDAYYYQSKYLTIKEEVMGFDKQAAITEARNKFEIEKRDREAALLRQKNDEINAYARKLEISNDELKQFAYVASHDLKEPLRMISSYLGLVNQRASARLTEEEVQFLNYAIDGAKRMDSLINGLLQFSKISAYKPVKKVSLNDVLKHAIANLQDTVLEKNALIEVDDLPEIKADEVQMIQLFQNLISNGIKYNKNTPHISVRYHRNTDNHHIQVVDNGIGIKPEHRSQVFVIFQRLHTRKEIDGTGIGLSICKKIVEQLQGRIEIHDNPDGGTIFELVLPG